MLDLVVSEMLMRAAPGADEGTLSKARAAAVNTEALARHARDLDLGRSLRLGRGEDRQGGRTRPSILADVFEAVVAAVYLDGGLDAARDVIRAVLGDLGSGGVELLVDPKTRLQEILQREEGVLPVYETVAESGPDHARKFEVVVRVRDRTLARGAGRSRRAAEQEAAARALDRLDAPGE